MSGRKKILTTAEVEEQEDGWHVIGLPCGDCGPYGNKDDAFESAWGLEQFYKYKDKPGFITSERYE